MYRLRFSNNIVHRLIDQKESGFNVSCDLFSGICNDSFSLYNKNLLAHYGCVNAAEFSDDGILFVSGGDDRRVLLWNVAHSLSENLNIYPTAMKAGHNSNIFCLALTKDNSKILSGGNDEQVMVHDTVTGEPLDYFIHEQPIYCVSISPANDNLFASACDDGRIRIFDIREPCSSSSVSVTLAVSAYPFHAVMFNPVESQIVATANARDNAGLWDLRKPKVCLHQYPNNQGAMSVRFNQSGTRLLCLRRKDYPIIYDLYQSHQGIELSELNYSNSCTMKSCCFAGTGDEFAVSGSDDYNVYVWKVPQEDVRDSECRVPSAHMILKGHRSVVNHVRYNRLTCTLASCGVEKLIKFWSVLAYPNASGGLDKFSAEQEKPRKRFTSDYIRVIYRDGQLLTSNYGQRSTEEDRNMLAFFDLLVQREKDDWSSCEVDSIDESESEPDELSYEIGNSPTSSAEIEMSVENSDERLIMLSPESTNEDVIAGPSGLNRIGSDSDSSGENVTADFGTKSTPPSDSQRISIISHLRSLQGEEEAGKNPTNMDSINEPHTGFRSAVHRKRQYRRRTSTSSSSSSSD